MKRALIAFLSVSMAACAASPPKFVGEEATAVLEACIVADEQTISDNEERRLNGQEYTPEMVTNIDEAISACRLVDRIDVTQVSVAMRPCLRVFVIKADVYEAAKPVVVDRTASKAEMEKLNEQLDRLKSAQRACENPEPSITA